MWFWDSWKEKILILQLKEVKPQEGHGDANLQCILHVFWQGSQRIWDPSYQEYIGSSIKHSLAFFPSLFQPFHFLKINHLHVSPCVRLLFWGNSSKTYRFKSITNTNKVRCVVLSRMNLKEKICPKVLIPFNKLYK